MTRDDMLTKLRDERDAAAARGDLVEALILNDRIRDLNPTSPAVERVNCVDPKAAALGPGLTLLDRRALVRCRKTPCGKSQGSFSLNSLVENQSNRLSGRAHKVLKNRPTRA